MVVVDGDTVKPNGQRLRLVDIDAPEIRHPRCREELRLGARARIRIAELLRGEIVSIRFTGRTDPYRRPLVYLRIPAGDVGMILVGEGLALNWHGGAAARQARIEQWCGGE